MKPLEESIAPGEVAATQASYPTAREFAANRFAYFLLVLAVTSVLGFGLIYLASSYHQQFAEAGKDNADLVHALSQQAEDSLTQIEVLSIGILERIEVDGVDQFQRPRMNRLFKSQVLAMPQLAGLFVYGRSGEWLSTDKDTYPPSANNADREYFKYHQAHPDDQGLHLGPVIRSRSTGDLVIPVSRRINGPDGAFAGVFLATLRVDYFIRFYNEFLSNGNTVVVLALADGTVLTRAPFMASAVGQSLASGEIFSRHLPVATSGTVMVPSVLDKVDKLFSYQLNPRYPLFMSVGVTKSSLMQPWYTEAAIAVAVILILLLCLAYCGKALLRQIRYVMQAESSLQAAHVALQKVATQDALTGLFNRRHLDTILPIEMSRSRRNGRPLGLIMIDIDYFKRFNDLYGHVEGDRCLTEVGAAVMNSMRRPGDIAVRYGGEELLVLLPDTDPAGTYQIATRIHRAIHQLNIHHAASPSQRVTASLGWSILAPQDQATTDKKFVMAADEALYQAKGAGRDRIFPALTDMA